MSVLPSIKNKLIPRGGSALDHFSIRKRNERNVACLMHSGSFTCKICLSAIIVGWPSFYNIRN
jgi:hypothetical protein